VSVDYRKVVRDAALAQHGDPFLALATVDVENAAFDPSAVGDKDTPYPSYGLFQERVKVGRGGLDTPDPDPVRQTQRFFADIFDAIAHGFTGTPGQLAAQVQRPAHPIEYAAAVDALYAKEKAAPVQPVGGSECPPGFHKGLFGACVPDGFVPGGTTPGQAGGKLPTAPGAGETIQPGVNSPGGILGDVTRAATGGLVALVIIAVGLIGVAAIAKGR